jgi:hypothetical protein
MADLAKKYAERCGYEVTVERLTKTVGEGNEITTHEKPALISKYLTREWSVWMDADSMMLRPMDELFEVDFDVAIPVQRQRPTSSRYGSYLGACFIAAHNTPAAQDFLADWSANQLTPEDQYNLNQLLDPYLDDTVYDRVGEVLDCDGMKLLLLDPDVYAHTASLYAREWPTPEHVRVIHFIGRLQRDAWRDYRQLMEAPCS